jgi:ribosomal protein S18 acetylase RimI-like enzyme
MPDTQVIVTIEAPKDYMQFVVDLGRSTSQLSVSEYRPALQSEAENSFMKMCEYVFSQPATLFIAKADAVPVGFLIFIDFLPDDVSGQAQGFVAYMAVEEPLRGRGIGTKMLDAAEAHAKAAGLPAIALMVTSSNDTAIETYRKSGYVVERLLMCRPLPKNRT